MKFSMTEQGKGDLLIQVTAWPGLTVYYRFFIILLLEVQLSEVKGWDPIKRFNPATVLYLF
jgi:hypothetical protein